MPHTVDYYLAPASPWTYLGHERFDAMVRAGGDGIALRVLPFDLGAVFKVSGGLPLPQRAPQRQAYRLVELRRFAEHLKLPMHIQPQFFPVAGDPAALLIVAVEQEDGPQAAMRLCGAVFAAVWEQQRNIASPDVLAELLLETGLPQTRLEQSQAEAAQDRYAKNTQAATDLGLFGAPTYLVDGEMFWGQDRLDFVRAKLAA